MNLYTNVANVNFKSPSQFRTLLSVRAPLHRSLSHPIHISQTLILQAATPREVFGSCQPGLFGSGHSVLELPPGGDAIGPHPPELQKANQSLALYPGLQKPLLLLNFNLAVIF